MKAKTRGWFKKCAIVLKCYNMYGGFVIPIWINQNEYSHHDVVVVLKLFTKRYQQLWNVRIDVSTVSACVLWSQPKLSNTLFNYSVHSPDQSLWSIRQKLSSGENCLAISAWTQTSCIDRNTNFLIQIYISIYLLFLTLGKSKDGNSFLVINCTLWPFRVSSTTSTILSIWVTPTALTF